MENFKNYTNSDEKIICEAELIKKHSAAKFYVCEVVCIVLIILLPTLRRHISIYSPMQMIIAIIFTICSIAVLPLFIVAIIRTVVNITISNANIILTNKKISGRFGNKIMDAPINKINSISIKQNLSGKINGYYKLVIATSSGGYKFNYIKNRRVLC